MLVRGERTGGGNRERWSSRRQTERGGKAFWDAAQSDHHQTRCWRTRIASQPFCPREPIMGTLCPGKGCVGDHSAGGDEWPNLYLNTLRAQQLDAGSSVEPTAPVTPEQRSRSDDERMQEHTHLARFGGRAAIPLTLLAQGASTTTTDAGRIHHAQAAVGLSAPLMGTKLLARRAAQRAIWLEGKILPREAARFPGQSYGCRPLSLNRNLRVVLLLRQ
jgi:hypothetical protein